MRIVPLLGLPLLALSGCAVGPDYLQPPTVAAAQAWVEPASSKQVDSHWWRKLGDPMLDRLVDTAAVDNLDLKQAQSRLSEARANRDSVLEASLPRVNVNGSATANRVSAEGEFPVDSIPGFKRQFSLIDEGFDASWELDLWGRQSRQLEAADARSDAAIEARRNILLSVVAEVVRAYIDLRSAQAQLACARAEARVRIQIARLADQRYVAGEAPLSDKERAQAQARSTKAELPEIESEARAAAYRLALLTGQAPEALVDLSVSPTPLPKAPVTVGVGLRSDLLRRRPDIRRAERELAAATANIGVATAELFPRVTLVGSNGLQAQSAGALFTGGAARYGIGPSLSWPVLSMGRIRAQIRAASANADQVELAYERAVLTAFSDSETALNRYAAARRRRLERDVARTHAAAALALARQRRRVGEDALSTLLSSQSDYNAAEKAALRAQADELIALASLYKALGGGWEAFELHRTHK